MVNIFGKIGALDALADKPTAQFSTRSMQVQFWGRIYNYDTLQQSPETANPAEIVHAMFAINGIEALGRIDGSFIVIITSPEHTIIARDRHGTYAQIYYTDSHYATSLHRLCSMEKGLKPSGGALATFLATGVIPTPHTAFENASKLEAGHALIIGRKVPVQVIALDNYGKRPDMPANEQEAVELYRHLHTEAIKRRIGRNPQVVGMLLSGGYDSGSNLAALRQCYDGEIRTYSIGFRGDTWTELPLARIMSQHFGTHHAEYEITGEEITQLPSIVRALGDPFVEGGLMVNYAAMRLTANDKLPVILGGDGSDQYFGTACRELALRYMAARCGILPLLKCGKSLLGMIGASDSSMLFKPYFRLLSICNALNGDLFGFTNHATRQLMPRCHAKYRTAVKADNSSWTRLYQLHRKAVDIEKTIDQVILFKASRLADMMGNTMAFPFTDLQLRLMLDQLPMQLLCNTTSVKDMAKGNFSAKYLLKACYRPLLPPEITSKKKQGGFAPMPIFFADTLRRRRLADFILSSSCCSELLHRHHLEAFLRHYDNIGNNSWFWFRQNQAIKYFNLLTLAIWWEEYVKNKEVAL